MFSLCCQREAKYLFFFFTSIHKLALRSQTLAECYTALVSATVPVHLFVCFLLFQIYELDDAAVYSNMGPSKQVEDQQESVYQNITLTEGIYCNEF